MKKTITKIIGLICMIGLLAGGLMACGGSSSGDSASEAGEDLRGKITMAGSTSMEKICNALSESFMEKYPNITVTTEFTGSSAGLEALASGSVDIGNASRSLSKEEADTGVVENVVAIDGIGVITDADNKIENLTSEELKKIYTGEIKNWKELGQKEEDIVVVGREAGSGTRDAFEELLDIADKCDYVQELDSTGAVLAKVASTPGAIGYVSLDVADDTVNLVQLNGVEAVEKNILSGDYVLSRPFVMATKGKISEQRDLVKAWFDYVNSDEGQKVIMGQGLFLPEK